MTTKLTGTNIAILLTDGFEQIEMTGPQEALRKAGAQTQLVSPKEKVRGWNHYQPADEFTVDVNIKQARADNFQGLLLPGGVINPDALRLIPEAIAFIKQFVDAKKPIAAICHGPWTLINAGAVKGRFVTSWPSLQMDLVNAGAKWVDKEVVQDENLITSRKPDDIPFFNEAFINLLASR